MSIVKKEDTTIGFNQSLYFSPITCVLRCIEEIYKASQSSGSMMIERTWEIAGQPEITINGQEIDLIGNELKQYLVVKNSDGKGGWDENKSRKSQGRVFQDYEKLNLDSLIKDGLDTDNPPLGAKGLVADAKISCKGQPKRLPLTQEEAAAGKKVGEVETSEDGKSKEVYRLNIDFIMGLHEGEIAPF